MTGASRIAELMESRWEAASRERQLMAGRCHSLTAAERLLTLHCRRPRRPR